VSGTASAVRAVRPPGRRHLVAVVGLILVVFAGTVVMREPWRGHFAKGDQWATAQTLRYARTWYRDGAQHLKFRLVQSPPTAEYPAPWKQVYKFALPGYTLLVHGILSPQELEPTVERLMRINLGIHLILALLLSAVAWAMARATWPDRPTWWALVAAHCGVFVLLFPVILYWGQNLCLNEFLAVPLFTFVVAARWLRAFVASRWSRLALDLGVASCIVVGTFTDFLFWVLVPYLLIVHRRRQRAGLPDTTDRPRFTVALPFAVAMVLLLGLVVFQGTAFYMLDRGGAWSSVGDGPLVFIFGRPVGLILFLFGGHFAQAFHFLGLLALGLAAWRLWPRRQWPVEGLPAEARGILVDLLMPCLIFTFLLVAHSLAHTFDAMKYVPFVALSWTFLTPLVISGSRRRWAYGLVYATIAVLVIWPRTSAYREFFPPPELGWEEEASFLRERTLPTDAVYSPTTEIEMLPPQRIALAERQVRHVYGPLDVSMGPTEFPPRQLPFVWNPLVKADTTVALYGPPALEGAFGAKGNPVATEGDRSLVRFPATQVWTLLGGRPDAAVRRQLLDVLSGGLRPTDLRVRPAMRPVVPLRTPVAMHILQAHEKQLRYERLYWVDDRHFHWKSADPVTRAKDYEIIVLGDDRYQGMWSGVWMRMPGDDQPALEWARLVTGMFERAAADSAGATEFSWRGYDVILMPVETVPKMLRAEAPKVASWEAYLLYKDATPVAAALGPARGTAGSESANWVCVLFDELAVDIAVPGYVTEQWKIRRHDEDTKASESANG
jgi:hypothetical protein